MKRKLITGFSLKSDRELINFTRQVLSHMTDNIYFIDPQPSLGKIAESMEHFNSLVGDVVLGNMLTTLDKDSSRKVLVHALNQLARYVAMVCDDNESKMLSSGFPVSKVPESKQRPSIPTIKKITDGQLSGEIIIRISAGAPVRVFVVAYKRHDEEKWEIKADNTKRVIKVAKLDYATIYHIKVAAINTAGQSEWTQIINFVVR